MSRKPSEPVLRAIAMLKANPGMTRYAAALANNITPGALYNSRLCKELMALRKASVQNTNKQ